jgi:hypothetical protein
MKQTRHIVEFERLLEHRAFALLEFGVIVRA